MGYWQYFGGRWRICGALMSKRLILVGCGDFGRELINWADDIAAAGMGQSFFGFLDNNPSALENYSYKLAYLGAVDDFLPGNE